MAKESFCEFCGDPEETLYHVVFDCPVAKRFWSEVKKSLGMTIPLLHPSTWATDVMCAKVCTPARAAMIVCGAWTLWTGRNAWRHGRKVWEPGAAVRYISPMLEELASLKMPDKQSQIRSAVKWHKPIDGWVKVNMDVAYDGTTCSGSGGVVIRDHEGTVLAGAARWFDHVPNVLTAEAMAAKEGLELAMENGYDRVILEVDCNSLVTLLADADGMRSAIGGLCFDIT